MIGLNVQVWQSGTKTFGKKLSNKCCNSRFFVNRLVRLSLHMVGEGRE